MIVEDLIALYFSVYVEAAKRQGFTLLDWDDQSDENNVLVPLYFKVLVNEDEGAF